jgi:predicted RNase H-like HicB family nuclease
VRIEPEFIVMQELIFEVREDEIDGGSVASALGVGIHTEAETLEELRRNLREAIACHYDDLAERPRIVRLHFVRDEVLSP